MLSETMEKALNRQVQAELFSAYLYQSMHAYFLSASLDGFATWMQAQALEEVTHAMKIYRFIAERGGRVVLEALEKPRTGWDSPLDVFEETLAHEKKVTGLIHGLVDLAQEERDHATSQFLQWFVAEQVEEEASAGEVLGKLRLAGEKGNGLFLLDRELGSRVFRVPADATITVVPSSSP